MPFETRVARITARTSGGSWSANWSTCQLRSRPRRSVGLWGDPLSVQIPHDGVGVDWDLTAEFKLEIGDTLSVVTLGGYYLRSRQQVEWGEDPSTPDAFQFWGIVLSFTTLPGLLRDGRGGMLSEGTLNPTDESGRVDTGHADYNTMQELVDLCLDALGVAHDPAPVALNTAVDGSTTMDGPGPLDWGLTRALPELESLLSYVGWAATLVNDGSKITVHRLRRAGETITLPTSITDYAEPYSLEVGVGVRPSEVVVTSGRTRTTIITDRAIDTLGDKPLEWVAFDSRTGLWMNAAEWAAEYPSEVTPGDIDTFIAAPGGTTRTASDFRDFGRLFSAVRLHADDRPAASRFVLPAEQAQTAAGVDFGKVPAVAYARVAVEEHAGQFLNDPTGATDDPIRLDGVQVVPGDGVFILPKDVTWVRMDPGPRGGYASAAELDGDDLVVVFAHEADTGDADDDYYASGWTVSTGGSQVTATKMSAGELATALADPTVVKIEAPWLRRVLLWPEADVSPTTVNDTALDAAAKQLALTRIGGSSVNTGSIDLEGIRDIEPGAASGAVSAVEWDLQRFRTVCYVNAHEVPEGFYDALQAAVHKSIAAGVNRFAQPGSSVGVSEPRAGTTPGDRSSGANAADGLGNPESLAGFRGRELSVTGRGQQAGGYRSLPVPRETSLLTAELTDSTEISPNLWRYDWREMYWNGTAWAVLTGGRTHSTYGYAYNRFEALNDGSGVEGNGIDVDALPGTFEMKPIGPVIVVLEGPFDNGSGTKRYYFEAVNQVDGDCEEPA